MSIQDKIDDIKRAQINRSIAYSERMDRVIHARQEHVKRIISGEEPAPTEAETEALQLRDWYYRLLEDYQQESRYTTTEGERSKRSVSFWERVRGCCDTAEVTPEIYMRAQFAYFHNQFRTSPQFANIATEGAVERAREYTGGSARIVTNAVRYKSDEAEVIRYWDKQLRNMCRAQKMSREEFYRAFVITGEMVFPKVFLEADPVYNQVKNGC